MEVTIDIPDSMIRKLKEEAEQHNQPIEEFIVDWLASDFYDSDYEDNNEEDYCPPTQEEIACKLGTHLQSLPEHLRSEDLCLRAINANGLVLEFVPEHLKNEKLCLRAVKRNGLALEFVPEAIKTTKICDNAFINDEQAMKFIPSKLAHRYTGWRKFMLFKVLFKVCEA